MLYILFGISVLMVVVCWCVKLRKKFRIRRQKQAKNSHSKEVAQLLQRSLQFTLQNFVNFTRVVGQTDTSVLTSGLQGCNRGTRDATKTKQRASECRARCFAIYTNCVLLRAEFVHGCCHVVLTRKKGCAGPFGMVGAVGIVLGLQGDAGVIAV